MILQPSSTGPTEAEEDEGSFIPRRSVCAVAKIEDTIELIVREEGDGKEKGVPKVNKWHEKFARGREKK